MGQDIPQNLNGSSHPRLWAGLMGAGENLEEIVRLLGATLTDMDSEIGRIISNTIVQYATTVLFAAVAVSGKFSRNVAYGLVVAAWLIGLFAGWTSGNHQTATKVVGSVILTAVMLGVAWWIHRPDNKTQLRVKDIRVTHLPTRPGEMLNVTVYLENVSTKLIQMRHLTYAQTCPIPDTLEAEKQLENALWGVTVDGLVKQGREAEMPTASGGEGNQIFESNPFGVEEFRSFVSGSHAVYFATIIQDIKTKKNLVEMLFFVRNIGVIHLCSQHNRP